jgi:Leucine-rich repeat (LRR) protein
MEEVAEERRKEQERKDNISKEKEKEFYRVDNSIKEKEKLIMTHRSSNGFGSERNVISGDLVDMIFQHFTSANLLNKATVSFYWKHLMYSRVTEIKRYMPSIWGMVKWEKEISDLYIRNFLNLEYLEVSEIMTNTTVESLTRLKYLGLYRNNLIVDDTLKKLTNINNLSLNNNYTISDSGILHLGIFIE